MITVTWENEKENENKNENDGVKEKFQLLFRYFLWFCFIEFDFYFFFPWQSFERNGPLRCFVYICVQLYNFIVEMIPVDKDDPCNMQLLPHCHVSLRISCDNIERGKEQPSTLNCVTLLKAVELEDQLALVENPGKNKVLPWTWRLLTIPYLYYMYCTSSC